MTCRLVCHSNDDADDSTGIDEGWIETIRATIPPVSPVAASRPHHHQQQQSVMPPPSYSAVTDGAAARPLPPTSTVYHDDHGMRLVNGRESPVSALTIATSGQGGPFCIVANASKSL